MARQYLARPCRRCGGAKAPREPGKYFFGHTWYCPPCAELVYSERFTPLCGGDALAHREFRCAECERIKRARQHDAAMRGAAKRRTNYPKWARPDNWDRYWVGKAHSMVKAAIGHGLLPKLDGSIACTDCGGPACEYDHRDYGRPLDVQPVCRPCNKRRGTAKMPSREDFQFARVGDQNAKAA